MEKDRGKLLRLFKAIQLLNDNPRGYTVNELAEKLGYNSRTIYRDLVVIQSTGFTLTKNKSLRYRISKTEVMADKISFNPTEAKVLINGLLLLESNSVVQLLLDKLQSFTVVENLLAIDPKKGLDKIRDLEYAIQNKKQVLLQNYSSNNSQTKRDRRVEPFAFSAGGSLVQCFEIETKLIKKFKPERAESIKILDFDWEFEKKHHAEKEDIFGMSFMDSIFEIEIVMGKLAKTLCLEEYPLSINYLTDLEDNKWLLKAKVAGFPIVGRFVLGLIHDIEVIGDESFKLYITNAYKKVSTF